MVLDFLFAKKEKQADGSVSLDVMDPRAVETHGMIAGNLQIKGDVYFSGTLRVDGRIDGRVSTFDGCRGQLTLSKGACINGAVTVNTALIDGTVTGPMDVQDKLECRPHAIIKGNVLYGAIHIADGAKLEAKCQQRQAYQEKQANSSLKQTITLKKMDFLSKK